MEINGRSGWITARRLCIGISSLVLILGGMGCSKEKRTVAQIRSSFETGNHEETILLCEHAIRHDIRVAGVFYYYGMSLMELGRDYEALRRFEEALSLDAELTGDVTTYLLDKGRAAAAAGEKRRAADRLLALVHIDEEAALGPLNYLVADALYQDREFEQAARRYRVAVEEMPDTAVAEMAYFNLAQCYVSLGDSAAAVEAWQKQVEIFPDGGLKGRAEWKLVNLVYEMARSEFTRGNYQAVIEQVTELLAQTDNISLVQRSRFLIGEAYERLGDYRSAYEQYKAIIREDRGASGRIVERAREKITTFQDSGLL